MSKNNKYFIERLEHIWNDLDLEMHQGFTCKYFDDLLNYFEKMDNINFDEVDYKLSEIKGIISIINPTFKIDIKIFHRLLKELNIWKAKIDEIKRMFTTEPNEPPKQ